MHSRLIKSGQSKVWLMLLCLLIGAGLSGSPGQASEGIVHKPEAAASGSFVYLPFTQKTDNFARVAAIWVNSDNPAAHQVAFFRRMFELKTGETQVRLEIFADTRYEVWLDGEKLGRGPARFSAFLHEYDAYNLDNLSHGTHVLAILVQWAPNNRRSESTRPYLQVRLTAKNSAGAVILAESDEEWKTILSSAWNTQSVPVHQWGLIGPTELVDFRQLPNGWQAPEFNDSGWGQAAIVSKEAVVSREYLWLAETDAQENSYLSRLDSARQEQLTISEPAYRERSIEKLVETQVDISVLHTGLLLPGWDVREINGQPGLPYTISITSTSAASLSLQTVQVGSSPTSTLFSLNGENLSWEEKQGGVPDVYRSGGELFSGINNLRIAEMPDGGVTLALNAGAGDFNQLLFEQGNHSGRRLLLAEPEAAPDAVLVQQTDAISMTFKQLPGYALIDLGRVVHGRVEFWASGAPGSIIDVGWDERLHPETGRALPFPGSLHTEWNQVDSFVLDGARRYITTIDARAGRYLLIAVWGMGEVQIDSLVIKEERYPLTQNGSFVSGEPLLNQIWQIGVDSLRSNMTDGYTDTPWRERGQWWGDAFVEHRINLAVFGDNSLYERGVLLMANNGPSGEIYGMAPNGAGLPMLDYGMLWVQSLHYLATIEEDSALLSQTYTHLEDFLVFASSFENPDTGLLDLPDAHWSQTAYIDTIGYRDRRGQSTALNSLYADTLSKAADLAEMLNDSQNAQAWMAKQNEVAAQIHALLYLPEQGRYAAALFHGELTAPTVHAQSWALSYGIVPVEQTESVIEAMLELVGSDPDNSRTGTYGFAWVLQVLGENGKVDEALELIRIFYGHMISGGATTWWEWLDADLNYSNSLSHGWSGSPTWFLSTYVLGGRLSGVDAWEVHIPQINSLALASGRLPISGGVLEISWERPACEQMRFWLNSPEGSRGTIFLPAGAEIEQIIIDGLGVDQLANDDFDITMGDSGSVVAHLAGGKYELGLTLGCGLGE